MLALGIVVVGGQVDLLDLYLNLFVTTYASDDNFRSLRGFSRGRIVPHTTNSKVCSILNCKCSVASSCLKRTSIHRPILSMRTFVESGGKHFSGPFVKAVRRGIATNRST